MRLRTKDRAWSLTGRRENSLGFHDIFGTLAMFGTLVREIMRDNKLRNAETGKATFDFEVLDNGGIDCDKVLRNNPSMEARHGFAVWQSMQYGYNASVETSPGIKELITNGVETLSARACDKERQLASLEQIATEIVQQKIGAGYEILKFSDCKATGAKTESDDKKRTKVELSYRLSPT